MSSVQPPSANDPADTEFRSALPADVRRFLARRLVPAMVPARFVVVDDLPRLPNGKFDRGRLPPATDQHLGFAEAVADPPANRDEAAAAELWAHLLGRQRIDVRANFFDLGGTSVTVAEMAARWTARAGVHVDLRRFLAEPTVRALVRLTGGGAAEAPEGASRSALSAAAVLPADIRPAGDAAGGVACDSVLLTEGTTDIGMALVRELLDRSDVVVRVLVRCAGGEDGRERLSAALRRHGRSPGETRQLVAVPGDLSRPYLGLEPGAYRELCTGTQLIVHSGAVMDPRASYNRLFPVNVLGTQEVLRLAGTGIVKPVHFLSSLSVAGWSPSSGWREDAEPGLHELAGGMCQTISVAERYMRQAARRRIPTQIYRHGQLATGQAADHGEDDFLTALIRACIALRAAPDLDLAIPVTPLDLFAATVVDTALSGEPGGGVRHVAAEPPVSWTELAYDIRAAGRVLDMVPYTRWRRMLLETVAEGELNTLTRFVPLLGEHGLSPVLGYRPAGTAAAGGPAEAGRDLLRRYPSRLGGARVSHAGITVRDHTVAVPLDHGDPGGPRIEVVAQEVVAADREHDDLPWLLFLQGGPGGPNPRPGGVTGWLEAALEGHRVLLLDQRGGGRSAPITVEAMAGRSATEIAAYLRHFRADSIVRDAELLRERVAGGRPWVLLGQSYGGFIALSYLSAAPEGVTAAIVSGGLPGLDATADDVFARTYAQAVRKNTAYYAQYPEDARLIRTLADHLDNNDVRLPDGDRLTARRMRLMGRDLGMSDGFERMHRVVADAWDGARISDAFQHAMLTITGFKKGPIFAMQEFIYARPGHAPRWAAHRLLADFPEFAPDRKPLLVFMEMMFPWMFEEISSLRSFAEAADLMAHATDMPDLYDARRLADNKVPLLAVLYADDPYTPNDLQRRTAEAVGNAQVIMTQEFHHNGLMRNSELLTELLGRAAESRRC